MRVFTFYRIYGLMKNGHSTPTLLLSDATPQTQIFLTLTWLIKCVCITIVNDHFAIPLSPQSTVEDVATLTSGSVSILFLCLVYLYKTFSLIYTRLLRDEKQRKTLIAFFSVKFLLLSAGM